MPAAAVVSHPASAPLEEREVVVEIPSLSPEANRRLTRALREVVGSDPIQVRSDRPRVARGDAPRLRPNQRVTSTTAMVVGVAAVGVCVGLIIALSGGNSWWLTALTFVVLAIALAVVVMTILGLASTTEYSDPSTAAMLSEQGVRDPDVLFSALVDEFTPETTSEHRTTAVEDDSSQAAAEQREAGTPSGGASRAVGPGGS